MNKEINTIIANLEGCIGMFDYLLTPTESNLLVSYIEELQQENKKINGVIQTYDILLKANVEENKQLKRIIKENTILVKDEYGDYQECNINPLRMKQKYEKQVDNWNKLKKDLINDINYWQEQEKEWIKLGFIKFGGEANNKIIFKKVLDKMQELEQGSDSNE